MEVTPETFGPIAQDLIAFGVRHSEKPALVVIQMPRELFQQFESTGIVETRVWGEHTEIIFAPDTFVRINQGIQDGTIITKVIDPFKDQR